MSTSEVRRPPSPRWDWVKSKAAELARDYSSPPIPVLEIAEHSGVDVVFVDFRRFEREVSGFCDFRDAKLFINKDDSVARKSFTIAHELGHWVLHREFYLAHPDKYPVLPRFAMPDRNDILEREANHFAANLLVPEHLLRLVIGASVAQLARVFNVSIQMMEWRVKNVGA